MRMPHASRKHKSEYRAPNPGASRVAAGRPNAAAAQRCVYDGQHRLGSYHGRGNTWHAVDRLGRALGTFATEIEAADAISAAAEAAS